MCELIIKQFARTRQSLTKTLESVAAENLEIVPPGFNNNIHWQLGHILVTAELFLFTGQANLPANYQEFFALGSKPANWSDDVPSVATLLQQLNEQHARINAVDVNTFATKLAEPFIGNETVGEMAAMGAFHEAMHVGQIQAIKRAAEATQAE